MSAPLRVDRSGSGVARVTLARPDVRNAFNAELIAALAQTFAAFADEASEELRVVVLTGDGKAFCAGADVAWMRSASGLSPAENEADARRLAEMLAAIDRCPAPVVARVHGAALGGGMGLCAVSDVVLALDGTTFGFTETKLGILPATIAPFVLPKIGESAARALFPTGQRFDAARAMAIGLVHEVLPDEAALDERLAVVVDELLSAGPSAARAAKAIVRELRGAGTDRARTLSVEWIATQRTSPEGQEGLAAFLEKRPPSWRH